MLSPKGFAALLLGALVSLIPFVLLVLSLVWLADFIWGIGTPERKRYAILLLIPLLVLFWRPVRNARSIE